MVEGQYFHRNSNFHHNYGDSAAVICHEGPVTYVFSFARLSDARIEQSYCLFIVCLILAYPESSSIHWLNCFLRSYSKPFRLPFRTWWKIPTGFHGSFGCIRKECNNLSIIKKYWTTRNSQWWSAWILSIAPYLWWLHSWHHIPWNGRCHSFLWSCQAR